MICVCHVTSLGIVALRMRPAPVACPLSSDNPIQARLVVNSRCINNNKTTPTIKASAVSLRSANYLLFPRLLKSTVRG